MTIAPHDKLSDELFDVVANQLFELQSDPAYSKPEIEAWLVGAELPVLTNIDVSMSQLVKTHRITLKELEFEAFDNASQPFWLEILGKLKNVYFERCVFRCAKLPLGGTAVWFSDCRFENPWVVTMGKNPQPLLEIGDPVYNACEFAGVVSLSNDEVDEETLGQYGVVFQDCKMRSLYLSAINLRTRLYVALPEVPGVFSGDRYSTHKTLEDFIAIAAVFKKDFDLSYLHVGSANFERCTFEEGIKLSGFVCDSIGFNSCDVDGRFGFDHASAKNVRVTDCHFKRSVIFDFSLIDVLLFKTSSFEQILSLEHSEIADCIGIGSCSMGKPPNFLNCCLSDEVIRDADRETFRIIKNSFDAVGNNIEANRYFSYEMNAYLKELRRNPKMNRAERWLLELNRAISDHGQNYWKPLLLIAFLPVLYCLASTSYERQWLYGLDPRLDIVLSTLAQYANHYASSFGIAFSERAKGIELITLLLGLLLSTLIWHFLVAIRRHKRR